MSPAKRSSLRLLAVITLIIANALTFRQIQAHNWACGASQWGYHWNRSGTPDINVNRSSLTGDHSTQAQNANAEWSADTILDLFSVNYHTDVELYNVNYGADGYSGHTYLTNVSGCHITHVHATANSYYTNNYTSLQRRAVYCHELGHAWGLNHMGSLDECLGAGNYVNSHSINDISVKYTNSHTNHN